VANHGLPPSPRPRRIPSPCCPAHRFPSSFKRLPSPATPGESLPGFGHATKTAVSPSSLLVAGSSPPIPHTAHVPTLNCRLPPSHRTSPIHWTAPPISPQSPPSSLLSRPQPPRAAPRPPRASAPPRFLSRSSASPVASRLSPCRHRLHNHQPDLPLLQLLASLRRLSPELHHQARHLISHHVFTQLIPIIPRPPAGRSPPAPHHPFSLPSPISS
jgi:hypothetical protein